MSRLALRPTVCMLSLAVAMLAGASIARGQEASESLSQAAYAILKNRCFECHSGAEPEGELRLETAQGFAAGGSLGEPLAAPRLENSLLWIRVGVEADMPPEESPQLSAQEKETLRAWLLAGAPYPRSNPAPAPNPALAEQAAAVFKQHCALCHGVQFKAPALDVRKHETLVNAAAGKTTPFVVAGAPETSPLWRRIERGNMPPKAQPRMSEQDKKLLYEWIAAGAPFYPEVKSARPFVSELDVQKAIVAHLRASERSARKHQRYFTFAHLHNNPEVSDEDLQLYKAALSKALNSLCWEREIVIPEAVDPLGTVFAVDLRDLDWTDRDHWSLLFTDLDPSANVDTRYPYLLDCGVRGAAFEQLADDVPPLAGVTASMPRLRVRADWFVAKATRPPLYERLLELPDNLADLEKKLEVTRDRDWLDADLMRGALLQSKVSQQNRLLDRHRSLHGAYWISYDFASNVGKGDLANHPLGPKFSNHPFESLAFEHDGGEIVFSLPNGLNGYFLTDAEGKRINEGPISIVRDSQETSGSPVIVNGLSCMNCHKNGVVMFQDALGPTIARNLRSSGAAREKATELFTPAERMNARLTRDETRFLTSLLEAVRSFVPVADLDTLREAPEEPIGKLARHYQGDLSLAAVAAELDFDDLQAFEAAIRNNREVEGVLGPLLSGGVVKRTNWDAKSADLSNSRFQKVAETLGKGIPIN